MIIPRSSISSKFRIVAVNDIYELQNLPSLKSFVSKLTDIVPSAVVLAGDFLSPSQLSAIDGGRGMVESLKLSGITHACLGNHEADLIMPTLAERVRELTTGTNGIKLINTNLRPTCLDNNHWLKSMCPPHEVIINSDGVKVGLLGLLSDEPPLYIGGSFHNLPLGNVLNAYSDSLRELISDQADHIVSLTHQTIDRDRDLARHILSMNQKHNCHVLIGGHEHDPHEEFVESQDGDSSRVLITKAGQDAQFASIIDIEFEKDETGSFVATNIERELVDLVELPDADRVVQSVVQQKLKGMERMEHEIIVDGTVWEICNKTESKTLCSKDVQEKPTTFGLFACDAIRTEMGADAALLPGCLIRGGTTYKDNLMTYKQIKEEFPSKIKMVAVPMKRCELKLVLQSSRQANQNDKKASSFLLVDSNFDLDDDIGNGEETLQVAVHMPLLMEDGKSPVRIDELIQIGKRLKAQNLFPGKEDWIPGLYLIIRYCCHARWSTIMRNFDFDELDRNKDSVLDRDEIREVMTQVLGHAPEEYALDDMIRHIDSDENGVIDREEFNQLLSEMQRH